MQFTSQQITEMQSALSISAATFRYLMNKTISEGNALGAGFYACELVRIERASHIAWNISSEFPTE